MENAKIENSNETFWVIFKQCKQAFRKITAYMDVTVLHSAPNYKA